MEISKVNRIFQYNNLSLEDPDPTMTPEAVKQFYTAAYPEFAQAIIGDVERRGENLVYPIARAVGVKGGEKSPPFTLESLAKLEKLKKLKKKKKEKPAWPHQTLSQFIKKRSQGKNPKGVLKSHHLSLLP